MFTSVNPNNSRLDSGSRSHNRITTAFFNHGQSFGDLEKLGSLHILNLLAFFVGVLLWWMFFASFWFEGATNSQDLWPGWTHKGILSGNKSSRRDHTIFVSEGTRELCTRPRDSQDLAGYNICRWSKMNTAPHKVQIGLREHLLEFHQALRAPQNTKA